MQLDDTTYACERCGHSFPRRVHVGRKPLYCGRSCRQRAYEERRARRADPALRKPLPVFHTSPRFRNVRPLYERSSAVLAPAHALVPDGVPDQAGRRPSLCGARVSVGRDHFLPFGPNACKVCSPIAQRHPPRWPVQPALELPVLRSVILRLASTLGPPAEELVDLARVA